MSPPPARRRTPRPPHASCSRTAKTASPDQPQGVMSGAAARLGGCPTSNTRASRRICGTHLCRKTRLSPREDDRKMELLRRSRLVFHVHDLHPAVGFRHRLGPVLVLALAVADGDEISRRDVVVVDQ